MFLVQHILIPPIILHASYELYNPQFFNQLGSILTVIIHKLRISERVSFT